MSKLPKRIQEIKDNQGKTSIKVGKEILQATIDIERENREANERLRKVLS